MKQFENGHILFFIFLCYCEMGVQSSFKIDWFCCGLLYEQF